MGPMMTPSRQMLIFRAINIAGLVARLCVLTGLLDLQFVVGEQPCPQFLFQRAGVFGLAAGLMMNVLWGMRPAHYAVSILAAFAGGASSTRHTLLLLLSSQFSLGDTGVLRRRGISRTVCLAVAIWMTAYLVIITVSILPECGLGMCPSDPLATGGVSRFIGLLCLLVIVLGSFAGGYALNRRLSNRDDADTDPGS